MPWMARADKVAKRWTDKKMISQDRTIRNEAFDVKRFIRNQQPLCGPGGLLFRLIIIQINDFRHGLKIS
jgi:hypothetical protein